MRPANAGHMAGTFARTRETKDMTRKDYQLIADTLNNLPRDRIVSTPTRNEVAGRFADRLERDNPRFDRARFLTACGVSP